MYPTGYQLVHVEPPPYEVELQSAEMQNVEIAVDTASTPAPMPSPPSNFKILNLGFFGLGWNFAPGMQLNGRPEQESQSESSV